jgi:YD repeat-containing protein
MPLPMLRALTRSILQRLSISKIGTVVLPIMFVFAPESKAGMPPGAKGWLYQHNLTLYFAETPLQACLSFLPAFGLRYTGIDPLVKLDGTWNGGSYMCRYAFSHPNVPYGLSTMLFCETGYHVRWPGICVRREDDPPPPGCSASSTGTTVGNPVFVTSGGKFQRENDFAAGPSESLDVVRVYRSLGPAPTPGEPYRAWKFSFEQELRFTKSVDSGMPGTAIVVEADQSLRKFAWNGSRYISPDPDLTLTPSVNSSDGWFYTNANGTIIHFKRIGEVILPVNSATKEGRVTRFNYVDPSTMEIEDNFGRRISVKKTDGIVHEIQSASLKAEYSNESIDLGFMRGSRLTSVRLVDGQGAEISLRKYQYPVGEPNYTDWFFMTGVIDENGANYATYNYDETGRVLLSEHANGADRYVFAYPGDNDRIVEDPLGTKRSFKLVESGSAQRVSKLDQPAGKGCAPAAIAFEYVNEKVSSRTDFNGYKICYWNEGPRRLEAVRVEGKPAAESCGVSDAKLSQDQRKVSTQWHPVWNVQTGIAEPLKITRFVYNGEKDGNGRTISCADGGTLPGGLPLAVVCAKIEQGTSDANGAAGFQASPIGTQRVYNFTYNRFGQVVSASEPGPNGAGNIVTKYDYYSDTSAAHTAGDLSKITNPKGQVTEYLEYTPSGLPLRVRELNGAISSQSWDSRGQLIERIENVGSKGEAKSTYQYDAVGQLTRLHSPDSTDIYYEYDDAHRLICVRDGEGNSARYTLDSMGNRILEEISNPLGVVRKRISRTYDSLNRLIRTVEGAKK